jgi:hypothetical protein
MNRSYGDTMPFLKYFITVGSILFCGLFAVSYALGPPSDSPQFERKVTSIVPTRQVPKNDRKVRIEESRAHTSNHDGIAEPKPPATPTEAPAPAIRATPVSEPPVGAVVEFVPLPKPRQALQGDVAGDDGASPRIAEQAPVTSEKNNRKAARRNEMAERRRPDVGFAKPFSPFQMFGPSPRQRVVLVRPFGAF